MRQVQLPTAALTSLQDAATAATEGLLYSAVRPFGLATGTKRAAYNAKLGEIVLCDPTGGAFTVTLPALKRADSGRIVIVKNNSASANTITIRPETGHTIDGATTDTIAAARGWLLAIAIDSCDWITLEW